MLGESWIVIIIVALSILAAIAVIFGWEEYLFRFKKKEGQKYNGKFM